MTELTHVMACIFNRSHHFLKSKTKEPPKFLFSSGIIGGIFISVYNFTGQ